MLRTKLPIIFIALLLTVYPYLGQAESVHISGLTFHVDELIPVDDGHSQVTVFGVTRIVANQKVDEFIVQHYLKDTSHITRFSSEALLEFVSKSWQAGAQDRAVLGLNAALRHPDVHEEEIAQFFAEAGQLENVVMLFQEVLSHSEVERLPESVLHQMIYQVSLHHPDWILRHPLVSDRVQRPSYISFLRDRFMEAVQAEEDERLQSIVDSLASLFSSGDSRVIEFRLARERYEALVGMSESEMLESWYPMQEERGSRELVTRVSSALALKRLHIAAESVLEEGNGPRALQLLSRMDYNLRTPTTHELVFKAIQRLPVSEDSVVLEPAVAAMMSFLSDHDERISQRYSDYLERQIRWLLANGSVLRSEYYFNQLLVLRPDPDKRNDFLRVKEAITWAALGRYANAERILAGINVSPGVREHFQLFRYGYYIDLHFLILLIGIPLILAFATYLYAKSRPQELDSPHNFDPLDQEERMEDLEDKGPTFSLLKINRALNPRTQEYQKLLSLFGLGMDCTLQQIKAAYRSRIKTVHPDLQLSNADHNGSDQFIQIKRDYERILELRKMLGYGKG